MKVRNEKLKAIKYEEVSRAKVSKSRNVVVSTCSKGGYTIAQQLEAVEDGKITNVFLKGAIHVDDVDGLINLRDAINYVINEKPEVKTEDEEEWD